MGSALAVQGLIAADPVGRQGGFQHLDAGIGQPRGNLQGRRNVIPAVAVGPQKTVWGQSANLPDQFHVKRRIAAADLDVKIPVAAIPARRDLGFQGVQRRHVDRPTQRDGLARRPSPHLADRPSGELSVQVVQSQIQPGRVMGMGVLNDAASAASNARCNAGMSRASKPRIAGMK